MQIAIAAAVFGAICHGPLSLKRIFFIFGEKHNYKLSPWEEAGSQGFVLSVKRQPCLNHA